MFLAYKGGSGPGPVSAGPTPLYPSAAIGGTAPVAGGASAGGGAGSPETVPLVSMSGQGGGSYPSKPQ